QQQYNLDKQELEAFLEHSRSALESDRRHQSEQQEKICARRSELQTLHSLGVALNEFDKVVEEYQEQLGRQAEEALGLALFSKINAVLLREPPKEMTIVDFSVLLVEQNRDLQEEIERFC